MNACLMKVLSLFVLPELWVSIIVSKYIVSIQYSHYIDEEIEVQGCEIAQLGSLEQ